MYILAGKWPQNKRCDIIDMLMAILQQFIKALFMITTTQKIVWSIVGRQPIADLSPTSRKTSCVPIANHLQTVGNQSPISRRFLGVVVADQSPIDLQPKKSTFDRTVVALAAAVIYLQGSRRQIAVHVRPGLKVSSICVITLVAEGTTILGGDNKTNHLCFMLAILLKSSISFGKTYRQYRQPVYSHRIKTSITIWTFLTMVFQYPTLATLLKYVYASDICDTNIMSLYIYRSITVNCGDAKWFQTVSESTEFKRKIIIFPGRGNHYTIALIQYGNLTLGNTLR